MGARRLEWDSDAWDDYLYWQETDRGTLRRINQLLRDIVRDPFGGVGKPEALKGNLTGLWSRRINKEHRIVYAAEEERIVIFACRGHYGE